MKNLTFILSLLMVVPSYAVFSFSKDVSFSREVSPGKGAPSDQCAYEEKVVEPAEPASITAIKKRIQAARDKKRSLKARLGKLNCGECSKNVRKALERAKVDQGTSDAYFDHLEGGNACFHQDLVSNVSIYNYWALVNDWEQIKTESFKDYSPKRMIAEQKGGNSVEQFDISRAPVERKDQPKRRQKPQQKRPTGKVAQEPVNDNRGGSSEFGGGKAQEAPIRADKEAPDKIRCTYASPNGAIKQSLCETAFGKNRSRDKRTCTSCLRSTRRRPSGKLSICLTKSAKYEDQIALLEEKIEVLEMDLDDEKEYIAEYGDPALRKAKKTAVKPKKKSFLSGLMSAIVSPTGLAIGGGLLAAHWDYNKKKKSVRADDEIRKYQGYPIHGGSSVSKMGSIGLGLAVGAGVHGLATSSGYFGCSKGGGLLGSLAGSMSAATGAGGNRGGSSSSTTVTGQAGGSGLGLLGAILAKFGIGGGANSAGGGVVTGPGVGVNTHGTYTTGANGQIIYNSPGASANGGLSQADIQARVNYYNQLAAQTERQRIWDQNNAAIVRNANALIRTRGPRPTVDLTGIGSGSVHAGGRFGSTQVPFLNSGNGNLSGALRFGVDANLNVGGNNVLNTPGTRFPVLNNNGATPNFNPNVPPVLNNTVNSNSNTGVGDI